MSAGQRDGTFQEQVRTRRETTLFPGDGRLQRGRPARPGHRQRRLQRHFRVLGNGDGTFQEQARYAAGDGPIALVAGDFNGDGRQDLAVANSNSNNISVLLGDGAGSFQAQSLAVGNSPTALVVGEFNGDGRTDLAVANSEIQ